MSENKTNARQYHILQREGSVIAHITMVEASSPEQAINLAAADHGAAKYIAVPDRNWTELTLKPAPPPPPRFIVEKEEKQAPPEPIAGQTELAVAEDSEITGEVLERAAQAEPGVQVGGFLDEPATPSRAELRKAKT